MCIFVSVTQVSSFRAIVSTSVRQSSSSLYMAGFGAKKEIVDTGKTVTRVADASAPCELYIFAHKETKHEALPATDTKTLRTNQEINHVYLDTD